MLSFLSRITCFHLAFFTVPPFCLKHLELRLTRPMSSNYLMANEETFLSRRICVYLACFVISIVENTTHMYICSSRMYRLLSLTLKDTGFLAFLSIHKPFAPKHLCFDLQGYVSLLNRPRMSHCCF